MTRGRLVAAALCCCYAESAGSLESDAAVAADELCWSSESGQVWAPRARPAVEQNQPRDRGTGSLPEKPDPETTARCSSMWSE